MLTAFIPPWQYLATKSARDSKSHPHRPYYDFHYTWLQQHSLITPKVCFVIDVKLCSYNPLSDGCNDNHVNIGTNMGIPQMPIPKGWHIRNASCDYTECGEDNIVFDGSDECKKFLYQQPSATPIKAQDIAQWGHHVPYHRFKDMISDNTKEYFEGSINILNENKLTSSICGQWPSNLKYSDYVRNHLEEFHRMFGPHLADIERQLCHVMRYKETLKTVQKEQREQYFKTFAHKTGLILRNRWDICNDVESSEIDDLFKEYGKEYNKENFIDLLQIFIKQIPTRTVKEWGNKHRDNALLDESTWTCGVCGDVVKDEQDEKGDDIPHPACEVCYHWFHVQCIEIDTNDLLDKKNVFLCKEHSKNGQFAVILRRNLKYKY
eukprot:726289_1